MSPQPDRKITEILKNCPFTLSAEIIPPRNGTSMDSVFSQIEGLIAGGAQYLAVTKGAGGSLRGGSLPIAISVKERYKTPCIAHFTCRDLLPEEVENQLIDHHMFGIRNILALRGDPPAGTPEWQPREGSYTYAFELVEQIRSLNEGRYLKRKSFENSVSEKTDFCIGVACYPDHPDEHERMAFFERKARAGAEFGISQMLFDPESYARFVDKTCHLGVPILPGTRLLRSQEQGLMISARFGVPLPSSYLKLLPEKESGSVPERTVAAFLKLTERLRALGAPGVHLFVISDIELAQEALKQVGEQC